MDVVRPGFQTAVRVFARGFWRPSSRSCEVALCCSGGAGSDQGLPSVHAHQREEDQHPEPAAAEHAGRPAASLRVFSSTSSPNHQQNVETVVFEQLFVALLLVTAQHRCSGLMVR